MKPLSFLGLFAVACSLAAITYFQPGKTPVETGNRILAINPEAVTRVQLQGQKTNIVFSKQDGQWLMELPEIAPAIQNRVRALIHIATISSTTSYPLAGLNLEEFKLDQPLNQLQINEHTIAFGGINPIGNKRYVAYDQTLHLVDSSITGLLFKPHTYFIQAKTEAE